MVESREARWIAWSSRTLCVLALVFICFADWAGDEPFESLSGIALLLWHVQILPELNVTVPGRALLAGATASERQDAISTLVVGTGAVLSLVVLLVPLVLILLPRRRARLTRLLPAFAAAATAELLFQLSFTQGIFFPVTNTGGGIAWVELSAWVFSLVVLFAPVAAVLYGQLARVPRLQRGAMVFVAAFAVASAFLPRNQFKLSWGARAEAIVLAFAVLLAWKTVPASEDASDDVGRAEPAPVPAAERNGRARIPLAVFLCSLVFFGVLTKRALGPARLVPRLDLLSPFVAPSAHRARVTDMAFSRSGEILATVGGDGVIRLWSTRDRSLLREIELGDFTPWHIEISPSSEMIAVTCGDAKTTWPPTGSVAIRLYSVADGLLVRELSRSPLSRYDVSSLAFLESGEVLAVMSRDGARVWSVQDGTLVKEFSAKDASSPPMEPPFCSSPVVSPRGDIWAIGNDRFPPLLEFRRLADGSLVSTLERGPGMPLSFYRGGDELFASGGPGYGGYMMGLYPTDGRTSAPRVYGSVRSRSVKLAPHGSRIEQAEFPCFGFRARDGSVVRLSVLREEHDRVVFSPDETMIAIADGFDVALRDLP